MKCSTVTKTFIVEHRAPGSEVKGVLPVALTAVPASHGGVSGDTSVASPQQPRVACSMRDGEEEEEEEGD